MSHDSGTFKDRDLLPPTPCLVVGSETTKYRKVLRLPQQYVPKLLLFINTISTDFANESMNGVQCLQGLSLNYWGQSVSERELQH